MYPEGAAVEGASLRDHLRVVLRRKWIILLALVTVPTVAVILSMRQEALYQATSQVLLNRQNLSGILSGVTDPNTYYQPERLAQTQAELARVPEVGQRVITAADLTDRTPGAFLASSSVVAEPDSDLIDFTDKVVAHRERRPACPGLRVEMTADQGIGVLEPRGEHADAHLAPAGRGQRLLHHLERFGDRRSG